MFHSVEFPISGGIQPVSDLGLLGHTGTLHTAWAAPREGVLGARQGCFRAYSLLSWLSARVRLPLAQIYDLLAL